MGKFTGNGYAFNAEARLKNPTGYTVRHILNRKHATATRILKMTKIQPNEFTILVFRTHFCPRNLGQPTNSAAGEKTHKTELKAYQNTYFSVCFHQQEQTIWETSHLVWAILAPYKVDFSPYRRHDQTLPHSKLKGHNFSRFLFLKNLTDKICRAPRDEQNLSVRIQIN